MKKIIFYIINLLLIGTLWSCREDELNDKSIFDDGEEIAKTKFDDWLLHNYTYPYNIAFKYRMEDIESSMDYTLAPADLDKARKLSKIIKHLWIETYDEIAGVDFTRAYIPKVIHLVGSAAYEDNGMIVGTAEGGTKVTLYYVNRLQINTDFLNKYYFLTMHHEFAHILHQTKNYDPEFERISEGSYTGGDWYNIESSTALKRGFVDSYASSEPREDFAETLAVYITNSADYWESQLVRAGETGAPIIKEKMEYIRIYMADVWGIDVNQLREIIQRRSKELDSLDLDNF
ncbi:zinc-binding metallopeptidase [Bacteroides sp.]|uniref:zinc-binding metallopeptidase n=1 Tax=Bacteroides sp. TaxID=29523 RepID=UPI0025C3CD52|nr:putative zinc-binding metallopeptidase [Bacteroides sp.]